MTEEHTKYLIETYPLLYQPDPSFKDNLMAFGFECGDGWFEILKEFSEKLSKTENPPTVQQVKEKLGRLRIYVSPCTDEQYALVEEAEVKSFVVCEICGAEGVPRRDRFWYITLCDKCNDEFSG